MKLKWIILIVVVIAIAAGVMWQNFLEDIVRPLIRKELQLHAAEGEEIPLLVDEGR